MYLDQPLSEFLSKLIGNLVLPKKLLHYWIILVYQSQQIIVCVCFSLTCVYDSFKLKIVSAVKLNLLFVFLITRKYMKIIENNFMSYFFTLSIGCSTFANILIQRHLQVLSLFILGLLGPPGCCEK
jgi:hypothetical protein